MDNPCKYCDKANIENINDCKCSCDEPCEQGKLFFEKYNEQLAELRGVLREMLDY